MWKTLQHPIFKSGTFWAVLILVVVALYLTVNQESSDYEFSGLDEFRRRKKRKRRFPEYPQTPGSIPQKRKSNLSPEDIKDRIKRYNTPAPRPSFRFKVDYSKKTRDGSKKLRSESRGEAKCRHILETIYDKKFISSRPDWLVNPKTGRNLELDVFNKSLMLAVEYQGCQHFEFPNVYHKTEEEFKEQVERDAWKRRACERAGVYLIAVPYWVADIYSYIVYHLPENVWRREEAAKGNIIDNFDPENDSKVLARIERWRRDNHDSKVKNT